jgi:Zn-dependent protease/predicted transcriptional regulator
MFGKKIHLFTILGFKVGIDLSWLLLAVLVTWSLAVGFFPWLSSLEDARQKIGSGQLPWTARLFLWLSSQKSAVYDSPGIYWWMGVLGALGLFGSIVFHEFWHSIIARRFGLPMRGITLFIFGGVAEMEDEPPNAKTELLMAVAGPASSIVLGGASLLLQKAITIATGAGPIRDVLLYLGVINIVLGVLNMVPAFPLDGGRVLRSILWFAKGNLRWATRIAAEIGSAAGILFIAYGLLLFIAGAFIAGVWYFLIGLFIRSAAQSSYRQVLIRNAFGGETIARFLRTDPVTVPQSISIRDLVDDYFYKYHFKMFPVTQDGTLAGCITSSEVKNIPREQWGQIRVQDVLVPCSVDTTVSPDTEAVKALSLMSRTGRSRLLVVQGDHLIGIITLKDMLKFLNLKMDLEGT